MRVASAFLLALVLACGGCASSGTDFSWDDVARIEQGMTIEQVRALLGEPSMVSKTVDANGRHSELWVWSHASVGFLGSNIESKAVTITFVDGVVSGFSQTEMKTPEEPEVSRDTEEFGL